MVFKIDLSKAFDIVSWLYLHLLLLHIGFELQIVKRIMAYVNTMSFDILINGARSSSFRPGQGPHQGCPLSTYLFLLVMEGLSRALMKARRTRSFQGINFGTLTRLTSTLLYFDSLIICWLKSINRIADGDQWQWIK